MSVPVKGNVVVNMGSGSSGHVPANPTLWDRSVHVAIQQVPKVVDVGLGAVKAINDYVISSVVQKSVKYDFYRF